MTATIVGTDSGYRAVASLLEARTGLSFPTARWESAERGIRRAMDRQRIRNVARYRELLENDSRALDDLIVELTVGETYFFRETAHFEFIRREVLRDVRRRRGDEHVIRVWSAGCASGEEAYSLAILFEQERLSEHGHILGTDISRASLLKARRAVYGSWSLRGAGLAAAENYLERKGDRYLLDETIRRRVAFEYLNLALDVYPSFATGTWGLDLILCRNVLIYFDPQTVRTVARRLFAALADGGWLITAASDPLLTDDAPFQTVLTDAGLVYRRGALPASCPTEEFHGGDTKRPQEQSRQPLTHSSLCSESIQGSHPPLDADHGPLRNLEAIGSRAVAAGSVVDRCRSAPLESQPPDICVPSPEPLAAAREALARCDYRRVVQLTEHMADAVASVLHVRALANLDAAEAERVCAEATERHPLSAELRYLYAVLLVELGRDDEADRAARRVIYLDRSLAVAHFTLGSILRRRGEIPGACRAYRNARDLSAARPADEVVPLSDGDHAARLAEAAEAQIALLKAAQRGAVP